MTTINVKKGQSIGDAIQAKYLKSQKAKKGKKINCPHCNKLTALHSDNTVGIPFIFKYQICLKCDKGYTIDANMVTAKIMRSN